MVLEKGTWYVGRCIFLEFGTRKIWRGKAILWSGNPFWNCWSNVFDWFDTELPFTVICGFKKGQIEERKVFNQLKELSNPVEYKPNLLFCRCVGSVYCRGKVWIYWRWSFVLPHPLVGLQQTPTPTNTNKNSKDLIDRCWSFFLPHPTNKKTKLEYIGVDPLLSRTHLLVSNKRPLQQSSVSNILIIFIVSMCCNKNSGMGKKNPQPLHWFSEAFFVKTYHKSCRIYFF